MTRRILLAAAACLAVLTLSACGTKQDRIATGSPTSLNLVLDYLPNPDHAGIYEAISDGAFRRSGLDVKPIVPPDPSSPLKLLAAGRADVAISYEPELLLARDHGLPLVAIGALVQKPLTSIMSLGNKPITRVSQLAGKTVGTAGIPYQSAYLKTILAKAHVPSSRVKEVDVGFNLVPAMLSHRVDATLGAFWNVEGVQLQRAHRKPHILRLDQVGVPTYNELVIVARAQDLHTKGAMFRSFLHALAQGHEALRRNPSQGVDTLLSADKNLDRGDTLASVKATLPAFFPSAPGKPFGYMDPQQWAAYSKWMFDNHLVKQPPTPRALTNEFLPGQGI